MTGSIELEKGEVKMDRKMKCLLLLSVGPLLISLLGCQGSPPASATTVPVSSASPYDLISQDSLFGYLGDLTSIQPYSGWRNSASSGEVEALDYVEQTLGGFTNLQDTGMELERQSFSVFMSTEIWDAGLTLTVNRKNYEVPAEGLRGSRWDRSLAAYFDSDGSIYDSDPNPLTASGSPLVVLDEETLYKIQDDQLQGRILFLDYSLIDYSVIGPTSDYSSVSANFGRVETMVNQGLAGVVLVVTYSNQAGESRGTVLGDGGMFGSDVPNRRVPILFVRLEDLQPAGINDWQDLGKIGSASLLLDSDVLCPGTAGNVIARIPGADPSKAVILGAHIDSPDGPGAFDDGSGSAALLEIARVLDASQVQPPVDVYLGWFGGHEIGVYGSAYFASTHQELLDRTLAEISMDGLGHPMDGEYSRITMMMTPYGRFGDERTPLADFLSEAATARGIALDRYMEYDLIADNSNFDAFNVPNVYLGYLNAISWERQGSTYSHYANHWHDPYETVEIAREVGDVFVEMTRVMLIAALEIGRDAGNFRVPPAPEQRAVIIASHTEPASAPTSLLRQLGMALSWQGFDVDLIPYGQAATRADLQNADMVVLAPAMPFPSSGQSDWTESELALLEEYVSNGGFLVAINSANEFVSARQLAYLNPAKLAINGLLKPMGVEFTYVTPYQEDIALAVAEHPLTESADYLAYYSNDVVGMRMNAGLELVRAGGMPVVGLVDYGDQGGQVLVIADVGLLQCDSTFAKNLQFLENLANYAASR